MYSDEHVNMPLVASTGPVLVRLWQHRPGTGPVLAHNGMFMGLYFTKGLVLSRDDSLAEVHIVIILMSHFVALMSHILY